MRDDLERSAHRVACVASAIDFSNHLFLETGVDAVQRGVCRDGPRFVERDGERVGQCDRADGKDMARDDGADGGQQQP